MGPGRPAALPPMSAVVLTGGDSRRMRHPKAQLRVRGETLPERIVRQIAPLFDEILISVSQAGRFELPPYRAVPDERPGVGPLMAILSCLRRARNEHVFFVACDIPDVDTAFLGRLMALAPRYDMVVPQTGPGMYEPLFAFYRRRIVPHLEERIAGGERRIQAFYDCCRVKFVPLEPGEWFRNLNTPGELSSYLRRR